MRNLFIVIVIAGVAIIAYVVGKNQSPEAPERIEQVVEISAPVEEPKPEIRHPIPVVETSNAIETETPEPVAIIPEVVEEIPQQPEPAPEPDPLPLLDASDGVIEALVNNLVDSQQISSLIIFKSIIRHFVVSVDNLTAIKLPQKFRFYQPVDGGFKVIKEDREDDNGILDEQNFSRYAVYIKAIEAIDLKALSDIYLEYYPLFQEAYEDLGYPDKYFNDRLIEVIDHLNQTPVVTFPIELKQPKVFYTFADPDLEALSAGQKLMIRIGPENSAVVNRRLKELRQFITTSNGNR